MPTSSYPSKRMNIISIVVLVIVVAGVLVSYSLLKQNQDLRQQAFGGYRQGDTAPSDVTPVDPGITAPPPNIEKTEARRSEQKRYRQSGDQRLSPSLQ